MDTEYYLIPTKYDVLDMGSIFKYENEELIDLDSNIEPKCDGDLPADWITISTMEMKWLLKKSLAERIKYQSSCVFKNISELDTGSKCFYRTVNGDELCLIVKRTNHVDKITFTIKLENGKEIVVPSDDIELYTDENKLSQDIEEIMKLLFDQKGDIQLNDPKKRFVLSLAYNLTNKRYFKMFLDTYQIALDITKENIQSLLRIIIKDKRWNILELVLQKCNIQQLNNAFLLSLAIEALKIGDSDLLTVIFRFAKNIVTLDNNETFLTNLFKEKIDEATIKKVIAMQLFSVNIANKNNESPLILACERLMHDVVEELLKNGADAGFKDNNAFFQAVGASAKMPHKTDQATKIVAMLTRFQATDVNRDIVVDPQKLTIAQDTDAALDALSQPLFEIMKLLVLNKGDVLCVNDKSVSVLTSSYDLPNKRLFRIFVEKHVGPLDLLANATGEGLLTKMVSGKDMASLKAALDKLVYSDAYEVFLLILALTTLTIGMRRHFQMIVEKCKNKNRQIESGEIFLSLCFKKNVKETLLRDVINSDNFDVNQFNASQETPLMLASERLMTACVQLLLKKGTDKSYRDYRAVDIVVKEGNTVEGADKRIPAKNFILDLMCGKNAEIKEKLQFTESGLVDVKKISTVVKIDFEFEIGDPVIIMTKDNPPKPLNGQVKWFGIINDQYCAGIELNHHHPDGFDGVINEHLNFECTAGHGILTTIDNVKLDADALKPHFLPSKIFDPTKYLKCQEYTDRDMLTSMRFKINSVVCAHVFEDKKDVKMKGSLRWLGTINNVPAGIVELDNDYHNGTNGYFWKYQLIQCKNKRAIALMAENISKYIAFKKKKVPDNVKPFKQIDVNSRVVCYVDQYGYDLHDLNSHGTVRWAGINGLSQYVYGIELDEECRFGTDGVFEGHGLFQCPEKRGIICLVDKVIPEDPNTDEYDDPESEISTKSQYCIPSQNYRGKGCGIQGYKGSSFLDSLIFALFSNTDIFDYMINDSLNKIDKLEFVKRIREIMLWKIVYPIREFSFVSVHKIVELRNVIREYMPNCDEIMNPETDLENFATILQKLCLDDQFLSFKTINKQQLNAMFLKTIPKSIDCVTSQQLLDISMNKFNLFFEKIPTCLLLQIPINPQHHKIVPLNTIDLSHHCLKYFKNCSIENCKFVALYRCGTCAENNETIKRGLLCQKHICNHDDKIVIDPSKDGSHSEVQLSLNSIICYVDGHAVAYVKENDHDNKWIYFDDGIKEKPTYPRVMEIDEVTKFFKKKTDEMVADLDILGVSEHLRRITENSYIFVYFNPTKTCY